METNVQRELLVIEESAIELKSDMDYLLGHIRKIKDEATQGIATIRQSQFIIDAIYERIDELKTQFEDIKVQFLVLEMLEELDIEIEIEGETI